MFLVETIISVSVSVSVSVSHIYLLGSGQQSVIPIMLLGEPIISASVSVSVSVRVGPTIGSADYALANNRYNRLGKKMIPSLTPSVIFDPMYES